MTRFVQIHTLTHYPASILNRDDAGFAKRIPIGGRTRLRISSQCLKRHWRAHDGPFSLREVAPMSLRSREILHRKVVLPLVEEGLPAEQVVSTVRRIAAILFGDDAVTLVGEEAAADAAPEDEEKPAGRRGRRRKAGKQAAPEALPVLRTGQVLVLGEAEVELIRDISRTVVQNAPDIDTKTLEKQIRKAYTEAELRAVAANTGLDAALFGRMVTRDLLANIDSAVHVAHAFTIHQELAEIDFFTAVDDMLRAEGAQAAVAHVDSAELTTGVYYGYVCVEVPTLLENLDGDRDMAAEVTARLLGLAATVSPGARRGATAPYAYADFVLVEAGRAQPRELAGAFVRPVPLDAPDLVVEGYERIRAYLARLDRTYPDLVAERRYVTTFEPSQPIQGAEAATSLTEIQQWIRERVAGGAPAA